MCEIVWGFVKESTSNWIGYAKDIPWYLCDGEVNTIEISKPNNEEDFADLYIELKWVDAPYDCCV